jgi:hypothetical protein
MRLPDSSSVIMRPECHLSAYARVARRLYTEYRPAGTPRTSARNLTLGRFARERGVVRDSLRMTL